MFARFLTIFAFFVLFSAGLVRLLSKKTVKKVVGAFLVLASFAVVGFAVYEGRGKVFKIDIPDGDLILSDVRPEKAKLCVPAAYTDESGRAAGIRKKGKTSNGDGKKKVSLKGDIFIVDTQWHSDEGFQQHSLVLDSKPNHFKDERKFVRRALCKDADGNVFLIQSHLPMNLTDFAVECSKKATNAVNLDMGSYGYGYVRVMGVTLPLASWEYFTRGRQTNWLVVEG